MGSTNDHESSRLSRLLEACRKGLHHDIPNQLIALHGLLQLLQSEEGDRLSPAGQDYLRRLLGAAQRTQALVRSLKEIAKLGGDVPIARVVDLPEMLAEILAEWQAPPVCTFTWHAPSVQAPRSLLQPAVVQALYLLLENREGPSIPVNLSSRPASPGIELSIHVIAAAGPAGVPVDLPCDWHERVECVLIRELADIWGGTVEWQKMGDRLGVTFSLPGPQ